MSEWKEYKLGDIANIQTGPFGSQLHKSDYKPTGIPCIMPCNITANLDICCSNIAYVSEEDADRLCKHKTQKGDIIYSRRGDIEKCAYISEKESGWVCGTGCLKVCINSEKANSKFIAYQLSTPLLKSWIVGNAVGTTMLNLNTSILSECPISLPSLSTQQKIANILSSLDDKIEVNRRINEQLEELAQALFKSWFVDFEPFKDGEFVESELGMIPKGWKVYQLSDLVKIIGGYSYKGNELVDSDIAMVTIKNFDRKGGFKIDGYKEIIPSAKLKESQVVTMHDIVVAHTDLTQNADIIGNPAMIMSQGGYKKLVISMDLVKVESTTENISNGFLYCLLKDARFKNHALGYVNGTTVLHLSKKALPDYKLALPVDLEILVEMSNAFDDIFLKEANNYSEIEHLTTLRDTLLPKLMSGEIDVNEVEI